MSLPFLFERGIQMLLHKTQNILSPFNIATAVDNVIDCHTAEKNKLCAWRHNMLCHLSAPVVTLAASHAKENTQGSNTFPRRIRSKADRCSRLTHLSRTE